MKQILIDSNILVYAINESSTKNKAAQVYLQDHVQQLVVTHQNITETLRVLTHNKFTYPMPLTDAITAVTSITDMCHLISPDSTTIYLALELIKKHGLASDKIFDAYLVATALSAGVATIATDNSKDFTFFEGITVINPFQ